MIPALNVIGPCEMKLSKYSEMRFDATADYWRVDREYTDIIKNYLLHGYSPGSFFTSLLANDAFGALSRSHPANTIPALKNLVGWIRDCLPRESYGNYDKVDKWTRLSEDDRRLLLEEAKLIYPTEEEVFMTLTDKTV